MLVLIYHAMVTLYGHNSLPGLLRFQRHRSTEPAKALVLSITSLTRTNRRGKSLYRASARVVNGRPLTPAAHWHSLWPASPSATGQISVSCHSVRTGKKSPPGQLLRLHFRGQGTAHKGLLTRTEAEVHLEEVVGTQSCTFQRQTRKASLQPNSAKKLKKRKARREPSGLAGWGQEDEDFPSRLEQTLV